MKLKERYFSLINDLANTSMDLAIASHWTKEGFSEAEYLEWQKAVSRFLRCILKHVPSDLVKK